MEEKSSSFLRKQAWDYFSMHASQRLTAFNFYLVLSSLITTTYFASFKNDSNLTHARPALAGLLCVFAFVFWKLDIRNKTLIKNAERALKHFEAADRDAAIAKVFSQEEIETESKRLKGWKKAFFWKTHLTYSDCFNFVFLAFFMLGFLEFVDPSLFG